MKGQGNNNELFFNHVVIIIRVQCFSTGNAGTKREIPILAWVGVPEEETTVERFQELQASGININFSWYSGIEAVEKALDIAQETGVKLMFYCPELETSDGGAVVSLLEKEDRRFLVIVNRNFKGPMKLTIVTDDSVKKVLKDGTLVPVNACHEAIAVDPGDVAIYTFLLKN